MNVFQKFDVIFIVIGKSTHYNLVLHFQITSKKI